MDLLGSGATPTPRGLRYLHYVQELRVCMYVCVCAFVCVYVCMYVCMYVCACVDMLSKKLLR